jgi:hypothetical protein
MVTSLKERIIQAVDGLSEEQQEKLLRWIQILRKERIKPPTGKLGLKSPFRREELYEDVLPHRL